MLHVASSCTPCWVLLEVVVQSLIPVKLLAPSKRTQHCWATMHVRTFKDSLLQSFLSLLIAIFTICTSPIIHLVCHPNLCITFVIDFSWVLQCSQEKQKTMLMQNFTGQTRYIMGDVQMANWSARVTILTKFHDPSPPHPHAPTLPPAVAAMYHHPLSFQVQLFVFCFILFCFFKFNLGLLKSFLELSSSIVFIFSVWLAELDFCCKYMHFKFKEAMNRKRCQIKSILLYNSSIGGNIKVET